MPPYHHGDLDQKITSACLADIRSHGELTLSIRGLSTKLGMSHNALYHHFKSKKELKAHLVAKGFGLLKDALDTKIGQKEESLEAFGLRYFRFFKQEPQLYRFMFANLAECRGEQPFPAFRQLMNSVGDDRNSAYHHWALVHGLCSLLSDNALLGARLGDEDIEDKVRGILTGSQTY